MRAQFLRVKPEGGEPSLADADRAAGIALLRGVARRLFEQLPPYRVRAGGRWERVLP